MPDDSTAPNQFARMHRLVESAFEGIVIVREWRAVDCNPPFARKFGYSAGEIAGMPLSAFIAPPDQMRVMQGVASEDGVGRIDCGGVRRDGSSFPIEIRRRRLSEEGLLGLSVRDVTESRGASEAHLLRQDELAHVSRVQTMGQMVVALAHELNQPLSTILNYVVGLETLTSMGDGKNAQIAPALSMIQTEAERSAEIVRRIRSFVRKQPPKRSTVDLGAIVGEAVQLMDFQLRHAGIQTRVEASQATHPASADGVQVMQVMINLIRNAVDAMTSEGAVGKRLTIRLLSEENDVRVEVIDQGCGVPPDRRHRLFDPFFTTKADGLGMGLNISRSIIRELGGTMTADANPGGGMTFSFTLASRGI